MGSSLATPEKTSDVAILAEHLQQTYPSLSTEFVVDGTTLQGVFLQDAEMRRTFELYPELLLVDATHQVCNLRMPLYLMLVVDGNGEGEIVCGFIVVNEEKLTIKKMVQIFKDKNPNWCDTKVILTDKDMGERAVLTEEIVQAHLQICLFHVLRTFKREITVEKMGITSHERTTVLEILQDLAYSRSEENYQLRYDDLQATAIKSVIDYYNTNWHTIRSEWVEGLKHRQFSLNIRTNNKLESTFQKLKAVVSSRMHLKELIDALMGLINTLRNECDHRVVSMYQRRPVQLNMCPTEQKFSTNVTTYAMSKIKPQLEARHKVNIILPTEENRGYTAASSQGTVNVTTTTCICNFFTSQHLPCKHIFKLREDTGQDLFSEALYSSRWSKTTYNKSHRVFQSLATAPSGSTSVSRSPIADKRRILSQREKFRKMSTLTQQLASLSSVQCGMAEFNSRMDTLQQLLTMWKAGSEAAVVEVVNWEVAEENVMDIVDMPDTLTFTPGPSEHVNEAREPISEPTEPVFKPTEVVFERTEPITKATEIMTEPTDTPSLADVMDIVHMSDTPTFTSGPSEHICEEREPISEPTDTPSLADVSLPLVVKKRGRPKGKINTAIGLPMKKRKVDRPVPFIKKTCSDRDLQCIQWFVDHEVATEVLQKNRILTEADIKRNPSAIPSCALDENFSIR